MTQTSTSTRKCFTLDEYLAYDDGTDTRYELVSGELVEMPSESDLNNLVAIFLIAQFLQFVLVSYIRRGTEIAVSGYRSTTRIPDLMVLTEEAAVALRGTTRSILLPDMPPPALVVEVVSPGTENEQRDYRYKRSEYAARRIQEYWIVDPTVQQVVVADLGRGAVRGDCVSGGRFSSRRQSRTHCFNPLSRTATDRHTDLAGKDGIIHVLIRSQLRLLH